MRLIRHDSLTRRGALVYGGLAAVALVGLIVVAWTNLRANSLVLLGVTLFLLALLKELGPLVQSWVSGYLAEQRVLALLRDLPEEYVVVTNFVPPGTRQGDSDLLILGPPGILVGEIKNYPGEIVYEYGKWYRRQPNGWKTQLKKHPSRQAKANAQAITQLVLQAKPGVPELREVFVPVSAAVIFVGVDRLEVSRLDIPALRGSELRAFIEAQPRRLSAEQVQALACLFVNPASAR